MDRNEQEKLLKVKVAVEITSNKRDSGGSEKIDAEGRRRKSSLMTESFDVSLLLLLNCHDCQRCSQKSWRSAKRKVIVGAAFFSYFRFSPTRSQTKASRATFIFRFSLNVVLTFSFLSSSSGFAFL